MTGELNSYRKIFLLGTEASLFRLLPFTLGLNCTSGPHPGASKLFCRPFLFDLKTQPDSLPCPFVRIPAHNWRNLSSTVRQGGLKELWYDNRYVSKQLERLKKGSFQNQYSFRSLSLWADVLLFQGEWSEMHSCKALKRRHYRNEEEQGCQRACCQAGAVSGQLPRGRQEPGLLVLFEPGLCLRGQV